jgi:hypothetical protein
MPKPEKGYRRQPHGKEKDRAESKALWNEYLEAGKKLKRERDEAVKRAKEDRERKIAQALLDYKADLARGKAAAGRLTRKAIRDGASRIYKARIAAIRAKSRREIGELYQEKKLTWLPWLQSEAQKGREDAITVLRARAFSLAYKANPAIRSLDNPQPGKPALIPEQKIDVVTKNGNIIYQVGKETVKDRGESIDLSREASQETMIMALRMARKRFGGKLFISGSEHFKAGIAKAAAAANLGVVFANSEIENKRKEFLAGNNPLTNGLLIDKGKERS